MSSEWTPIRVISTRVGRATGPDRVSSSGSGSGSAAGSGPPPAPVRRRPRSVASSPRRAPDHGP